jgi:putative flavoprotein involved in K+ transport
MSDFTFDTIVIGGGQAGLAMGYFLARERRNFVILDAGERVGDPWRERWDSLRLFTQAGISGLPGLPFPAPGPSFPGKDAVAAYLEGYAERFALPVHLRRRVDTLCRHDDGYLVQAGAERYSARHVVVATGPYHHPRIPALSIEFAPAITQLHSSAYRTPGQVPEGAVLVVGAGNSGAEIAVELAATRRIYLAGRDTGHIPLGHVHNHLALWLAEQLLTTDTRLGRKARAASQRGAPLVRLTPTAIAAAGVERVSRVEGSADGKPRLADGRVLDVSTVVWATGYRPDFRWIALPIFDADGNPIHHRGVVDAAPGLYFVGLHFLHTPTSAHIGGVGKDARYIAAHLAARAGTAKGRFTHAPASPQSTELA